MSDCSKTKKRKHLSIKEIDDFLESIGVERVFDFNLNDLDNEEDKSDDWLPTNEKNRMFY